MSWTSGRVTGSGPTRWSDQDYLIGEDSRVFLACTPVSAPPPGMYLIACRCGRALSRHDMYRAWPPRPTPQVTSGEAFPIPRIVCADCAVAPTVEAEE